MQKREDSVRLRLRWQSLFRAAVLALAIHTLRPVHPIEVPCDHHPSRVIFF